MDKLTKKQIEAGFKILDLDTEEKRKALSPGLENIKSEEKRATTQFEKTKLESNLQKEKKHRG